jgi:hypothetical protein
MQEAKIKYYKNKLNTYGAFKSMFSFDALPQYIIKIWGPSSNSMVKKEYETSLKYPELYAKIVKINFDKRWMAQEKLDTDRVKEELDELADIFGFDYPSEVTGWLESIALNSKEKKDAVEELRGLAPEKIEMFNKWLDFYYKTSFITTKNELDLNPGNMGYDKEGNLKLLDI